MIAVLDASPVCYLVATEAVNVLPDLFEQLIVPGAVMSPKLLGGDCLTWTWCWADSRGPISVP